MQKCCNERFPLLFFFFRRGKRSSVLLNVFETTSISWVSIWALRTIIFCHRNEKGKNNNSALTRFWNEPYMHDSEDLLVSQQFHKDGADVNVATSIRKFGATSARCQAARLAARQECRMRRGVKLWGLPLGLRSTSMRIHLRILSWWYTHPSHVVTCDELVFLCGNYFEP